jgi:hypothetical protein
LARGNESLRARGSAHAAKNQPLLGADAQQTTAGPQIWNGNYLEGAVLVKKQRRPGISNDLACIANPNQLGIRGMRIIESGPLIVVKNEAVMQVSSSVAVLIPPPCQGR